MWRSMFFMWRWSNFLEVVNIYKHRVIIDWIVYLIIIIILSFILGFGCFYISEIAQYGIKPPINITFIMGYALARVVFAPILLSFFTIGRLMDKSKRSTPIILNRRI